MPFVLQSSNTSSNVTFCIAALPDKCRIDSGIRPHNYLFMIPKSSHCGTLNVSSGLAYDQTHASICELSYARSNTKDYRVLTAREWTQLQKIVLIIPLNYFSQGGIAMCTAAVYATKNHYFGRNLDLEFSYHETVTITPRNKVLPMRMTWFRIMP